MKAATEKTFKTLKDTKYTDKQLQKLADELLREDDRVIRWKKAHKLLRLQNKKARQEQDNAAEDAKYFRQEKFIKKTKSEKMGLRWGVAMPPMTWNALITADTIATGKSDLSSPDKESFKTKDATNSIVKDLEKAFPQYKVS